MDKLIEAINERDNTFEEQTMKIFEMICLSLDCVTNFLNSVDPMFAAGVIIWEDVNVEDEEMLNLVGYVEYEPGTHIKTDNGLVTITEENIEYFQRIIHMALPVELISLGNEDDILEFLYQIHEYGQGEDFTDIIENAPKDSVDFDLSKLTDKQKQSLMYYNFKQIKNNN